MISKSKIGALCATVAIAGIAALGTGGAASAQPLSSSTAQLSATSENSATSSRAIQRLEGPFAFDRRSLWSTGSRYASVGTATLGKQVPVTATYDLGIAAQNAAIWNFPAVGTVGVVHGTGDAKDVCLTYTSKDAVGAQTCNGSKEQQFTWTGWNKNILTAAFHTTWNVSSPHGMFWSDNSKLVWNKNNLIKAADAVQTQYLKPAVEVAPLSAQVGTLDNEARTAVIYGSGQRGATVTLNTNGVSTKVTVDSQGQWSTKLTGLKVGVNSVTAIQTFGTSTSEPVALKVDITQTTPSVTASLVNVNNAERWANFSGTGVAGATLKITGPNGSQSGAVWRDGTWWLRLDNLNVGANKITITQTVNGVTSSPITLNVDVAEQSGAKSINDAPLSQVLPSAE